MAGKKKDSSKQKENGMNADFDAILADLQRTRADFENYRKRIESEKEHARDAGKSSIILKLLPVVDNIDRAVSHMPKDLKDNNWAQGVANLQKNLQSALASIDITKIDAEPGTPFEPELHEAIQMEDGDGDKEVIAEELQAGYMLGENVIRHSLVKVKKI